MASPTLRHPGSVCGRLHGRFLNYPERLDRGIELGSKIFGIGFHKTGTTSLARALEIMGYRVCDVVGADDPSIGDRALEMALEKVPEFDAFEDFPWPILFRELDSRYPGSKFILTIRPEDAWIQSVLNAFSGKPFPIHEWIYGSATPEGNETAWVERYRQHNEEVLSYFQHRPEDLLVLRLTEGEGWEKLCPFLGRARPFIPFPHSNSRLRRGSWKERAYNLWARTYYVLNRWGPGVPGEWRRDSRRTG